MAHIIITGFSDEIAPGFDAQLEALREFGLDHLELRAADGINVSDFSLEKLLEVKEKLQSSWHGQSLPPEAGLEKKERNTDYGGIGEKTAGTLRPCEYIRK